MPNPFTIRIFVPDGDPEGIRVIDRMNWTGLGIVFPRPLWPVARNRPDVERTGVYILVGYEDEEDDLPSIYVGQGDGVKNRIDSHDKQKDFWDWGIAFVSNSGGLNRAHITWLEYALVEQAHTAKQCRIQNGNLPQEPALSESEKADTKAFLQEILQILPLVGLRVFEQSKSIATPKAKSLDTSASASDQQTVDTIIVPARREGFEQVFLGENCWYAVRISGGKMEKIKYIAAYQSQPISAITHLAPVESIEPYGDRGKYRLLFSEPAREIGPIPIGDAPSGSMQGPRYTNLKRLKAAKTINDLLL